MNSIRALQQTAGALADSEFQAHPAPAAAERGRSAAIWKGQLMDGAAPNPETSSGWRPGTLIGMGAGLLCCTGPAFLWLAIWGLPDDPAGILRQGYWLGPLCVALGAA